MDLERVNPDTLQGDDTYTLPENPEEITGRVVMVKASANETTKRLFPRELYIFYARHNYIERPHLRPVMGEPAISVASLTLSYQKMRDLFELLPEPDYDRMFEKSKKGI